MWTGVQTGCTSNGHHCSGRVGVPTRSPTAPGRKSYRRGSVARIKNLCSDLEEISAPRAEYESDKFARSAVESVKSRLSWWRKRAREHNVEAYPITVERLQLLWALLKSWIQVCSLSVVKNQHIRLVHPWTDALDLEMREGKRACDRGIGPPQKCGAFDMQKLANLSISDNPSCADGPMWPREGTLCGCWWAMWEIELSLARCMQVAFLGGPGCGRCVFDLPVSKTDPQALGKKRTHTCACSPAVVGSEALCPVKVAKKLHNAALRHEPVGAHPIPGMRPLWPTVDGKFVSKRAATLTFQKLAKLTAVDTTVTGHACRVTGAQAMAVAGVDVWLIQAFCRWGSRAVVEYIRDCHLSSAMDVATRVTRGLRLMEVLENIYRHMELNLGSDHAVACEQEFEQVLEAKVAESGVVELKCDHIKDQIERRMMKTAREGRVKFVLCTESGFGKLHIKKNDTVCWCGRQWSQQVEEECPETVRCKRCLRALAASWSNGEVQVLDQ